MRFLSIILLFIVSSCLVNETFSQQTNQSGFIKELHNNEPIIGAVIQSADQYGITNEFGYFTIQLEGEDFDTLHVSHVAYQPKEIVVNPNTESLLTIYMDVYQLEEIHIVNDNKFKTRKDQAIGSLIIDADDLCIFR